MGFLFLVLYPLLPPPPACPPNPTHTHTPTTLASVPLASLWRPLVSAAGFCVAGVGFGAVHRGRMYAPVSPGVRPVSLGLSRSAAGFCVAGVGFGAVHRGRMYAPVSPGVRPVSLGLSRSAGGFCVAGAGLGAPGTHIVHTLPSTPVHAHTYIHTHKLTHHHPSITLILPLPL